MTATSVEERVDWKVVTDHETSTDKTECAHIVLEKGDEETSHAYVMRARIEGFPVTALCGFTWVPNRQATGLPICEECKTIYEDDPFGKGDRGELPDE